MKEFFKNLFGLAAGLLIVASVFITQIVILYLASAGVSYIICWSFGIDWTIKTPIGVALIFILTGGFKWFQKEQEDY